MAISFVGTTTGDAANNNSTWTLTKPSGVLEGDLLICFIGIWDGGSFDSVDLTPPSGWTLEMDIYSGGSFPCQVFVISKVAGASEPGSWVATYDENVEQEVGIVVAYRGASGIAVDRSNQTGSATSLSTGSVTNDSSNNWRLTAGFYNSSSTNFEIDSNEIRERAITDRDESDRSIQIGAWDSNGTISTGSTSRNITRDAVWGAAVSYIAILEASDEAVPGDMEFTLPDLSMGFEGRISYDAELDTTLPLLEVDVSGIATPPEGGMAFTIEISVDVDGTTPNLIELDVVVLPSISMVAETRPFGIRVIDVSSESRTVTPRKGAAD